MKISNDTAQMKPYMEKFSLCELFERWEDMPFQFFELQAGEVVLGEGQEIERIYYLVEGHVKTTSSVETGKSLLLRFNQPLAVLGDLELARKIPTQSHVVAATKCKLIGLSVDYIYKEQMNNPRFLRHLLEQVSHKLQTNTTASRVNLLASVEERFASYLLSTTATNAEAIIELRATKVSDIADLLGTTHRHLNRVIKVLVERGIIQKEKKQIRIVDEEQLEQLSKGIRYE